MRTNAAVTTWLTAAGAGQSRPGDLLGLLPAGYDELRTLYAGLWDAGVDPVTLELCRLRLATLIGSTADLAVRDPRAVAAGLSSELVSDLPAWPSSDLFSSAQRAALGFTEQYVVDPHGFTDDEAAAMHRHFTPEQLATLTIAVATFDALARVRTLLTVDADRSTLTVRDAEVGVALVEGS